MRRLIAFLVAAAVAFPLAACGAVTPYAATVNGERITQRELDAELEAIRENESYVEGIEAGQLQVLGAGEDTFSTAFVSRVLTRQIYLELVDQEVAEREIEVTDAARRQAEADVIAGFRGAGDPPTGVPAVYQRFPESYRDLLVDRTAKVNVLQQALAGVNVDDAAIRRFYEENPDRFQQTCSRHVLLEQRPEAEAAAARIAAGEDFGTVARELSKDPGSAQQGGDLGCVGPGNFVPEFETAMESLQPGQTSGIVETQFGFHLIQVTDRRPQPLAEVESQIRQELLADAEDEFNGWVSEAVGSAKVTVNPRYGRFVRDGDRIEVVPPQAPTTTTSSTLPTGPDGAPGVGGGPAGGGGDPTGDGGGADTPTSSVAPASDDAPGTSTTTSP